MVALAGAGVAARDSEGPEWVPIHPLPGPRSGLGS